MGDGDTATSTVSTVRAAAGIAGVTVATVQWWLAQKLLSAPPWSIDELRAVADTRLPARPRGVAHGTDECWRAGCTHQDCRDAHRAAIETRRDTHRESVFPPGTRQRLLTLIADGVAFDDAVDEVGVTGYVVWGRALKHPDFRAALDDALTAGRDPSLPHGTAAAYRRGKCKCPDCRDARRRHNAPNR